MRNDVVLCWEENGFLRPSHFTLHEFESPDGVVVISRGLVTSLERIRRDLPTMVYGPVKIIITSGTRSEAYNAELAKKLGWTNEGGLVAHDSRHLPRYGGIAADFYAIFDQPGQTVRVPRDPLAVVARRYFSYVKADYEDGHVHGDNR